MFCGFFKIAYSVSAVFCGFFKVAIRSVGCNVYLPFTSETWGYFIYYKRPCFALQQSLPSRARASHRSALLAYFSLTTPFSVHPKEYGSKPIVSYQDESLSCSDSSWVTRINRFLVQTASWVTRINRFFVQKTSTTATAKDNSSAKADNAFPPNGNAIRPTIASMDRTKQSAVCYSFPHCGRAAWGTTLAQLMAYNYAAYFHVESQTHGAETLHFFWKSKITVLFGWNIQKYTQKFVSLAYFP